MSWGYIRHDRRECQDKIVGAVGVTGIFSKKAYEFFPNREHMVPMITNTQNYEGLF